MLQVALRSLTLAAMVLVFMFDASWRLTIITFISVPCVILLCKVYGEYYRCRHNHMSVSLRYHRYDGTQRSVGRQGALKGGADGAGQRQQRGGGGAVVHGDGEGSRSRDIHAARLPAALARLWCSAGTKHRLNLSHLSAWHLTVSASCMVLCVSETSDALIVT